MAATRVVVVVAAADVASSDRLDQGLGEKEPVAECRLAATAKTATTAAVEARRRFAEPRDQQPGDHEHQGDEKYAAPAPRVHQLVGSVWLRRLLLLLLQLALSQLLLL